MKLLRIPAVIAVGLLLTVILTGFTAQLFIKYPVKINHNRGAGKIYYVKADQRILKIWIKNGITEQDYFSQLLYAGLYKNGRTCKKGKPL